MTLFFDGVSQDYEEAVEKGKQCNDWSKVISLEVDMIVQNVTLKNGTVVARRLDNLIELIFNAWKVEEPNADIGDLFLKCGGIEALISAISAFSDCVQIQLLGYEALTMLVLEAANENAAAQSRLRKRVLKIHSAGGIEVVLKNIAIHKKEGPRLVDAVSFLARMLMHCFDPDACELKRFKGAKAVMMTLYDEQDTEDLMARIDAPLSDDLRDAIRTFRVGVVHGYS
jgi:hypothetical protein